LRVFFLFNSFFVHFFLVRTFLVHALVVRIFLLEVDLGFLAQRPSSSILSSTRSAQLRRQHRNISPGTLVLDQNLFEILEFVFADLRVGLQDLLCR